jgi:hypothetical protein
MKILSTIVDFLILEWDIYNGITCWFSAHFWDVHDYHVRKGGDGNPMHHYNYTCPSCGKEFVI